MVLAWKSVELRASGLSENVSRLILGVIQVTEKKRELERLRFADTGYRDFLSLPKYQQHTTPLILKLHVVND